MQCVPSARGQRGTHKGGLRPPLSLPPLKIPLLKPPAVFVGKFVRLFRLCMNRAEHICKLSVNMKTGAAYVPPFPFTKAEVHTHFCQPSVLSAQRKGGGISKGGNPGSPLWLRAKHACIDCRLRKNKPATNKPHKTAGSKKTNQPR